MNPTQARTDSWNFDLHRSPCVGYPELDAADPGGSIHRAAPFRGSACNI